MVGIMSSILLYIPINLFKTKSIVNNEWICVYVCFIVDVNECYLGIDNCHVNAQCINQWGTYNCKCSPGYTGDGQTCSGKIELTFMTFYFRKCKASSLNFILKYYKFISDIDECQAGACNYDSICNNTIGSYHCKCKDGYTEGANGNCYGNAMLFITELNIFKN